MTKKKTKKKHTPETIQKLREFRAKQPRDLKSQEQKEAHIQMMKGNKFNLKLSTQELKQEAYKQYCDWIAKGETKEAFVFDHPEVSVTYKTMEKYIRENPKEFPPIHKEMAEAKGYQEWLRMGKEMMLGEIDAKVQPAIYQMFMRNKYKWDQPQPATNNFEPEARRLLAYFEERITEE